MKLYAIPCFTVSYVTSKDRYYEVNITTGTMKYYPLAIHLRILLKNKEEK